MLRRLSVLLVVLAATGLAVPAAAAPRGPLQPTPSYPTQQPPSSLEQGQVLHAGQALFSELGQGIELALQTDGNLVLSVVSARRVLWSTHTSGANNVLQMQTDGNAVLRSASGAALWSTGTARSGAYALVVTPDGRATVNAGNEEIWLSPNAPAAGNGYVISQLVSPHGHYRALMQTDGNLVVSSIATGALWSTGTAGHPGSLLELQHDGNLVVYGPKALWTSHTGSGYGTFIQMQDDGNLVLYAGSPDDPHAVWSSHAAGRA